MNMPKITNDFIQDFSDNITPEMKACVLAGVPLDHEYKNERLVIKTRVKVGFIRNKKGKIIKVIQKNDTK